MRNEWRKFQGVKLALRISSERLRCAQVRAPLDWRNPAHSEVHLAVMRLATDKPQARRGALLMRPGGPGVEGLPVTFRLWEAFVGSDAHDPQSALQLRLLDEYDMVGFFAPGCGREHAIAVRHERTQPPGGLQQRTRRGFEERRPNG